MLISPRILIFDFLFLHGLGTENKQCLLRINIQYTNALLNAVKRKKEQTVKKEEPSSAEPLFYVALVIKGTEKQYLNLLKYVNNRNGSKIIYQCKSLTYLHVSRDDGVKFRPESSELVLDAVEQ